MSGVGAERGDPEGSAGEEKGRSDGERPTEAADGQHISPESDGAEDGWRGEVRGHIHTYRYVYDTGSALETPMNSRRRGRRER